MIWFCGNAFYLQFLVLGGGPIWYCLGIIDSHNPESGLLFVDSRNMESGFILFSTLPFISLIGSGYVLYKVQGVQYLLAVLFLIMMCQVELYLLDGAGSC